MNKLSNKEITIDGASYKLVSDSERMNQILTTIRLLLTCEPNAINCLNIQKMVWIWNITKFILWTLDDWSQPRIAKQFEIAHNGGSVSKSITKVMNVIDTKDPKFYPDLLRVNEIYPILSLGRSKYRIKKEEEYNRRQKFGTSKRALKK